MPPPLSPLPVPLPPFFSPSPFRQRSPWPRAGWTSSNSWHCGSTSPKELGQLHLKPFACLTGSVQQASHTSFMYECPECGGKYARQNSLTRHLHNHRKTKRYTCSVCHVAFYRGDLLSRHAKLHQGAAIASHESDLPGMTTRKRCHTACDRCRDHRTKCNGQLPCSTCVKANQGDHCHFKRGSNRLSHIPTVCEDPSISDEPGENTENNSTATQNDDQDLNENQDESHLSTLSSTLQSAPTYDPDIEQHHSNHQVPCTALHSHMTFLPSIEEPALQPHPMSMPEPTSDDVHLQFEPQMFNVASWPWLHESIYMPSTHNTLLDSDITGAADFTRNVISDPHMQTQHETYGHRFPGDSNGLQSISYARTQPMTLGSVVQGVASTQANSYGTTQSSPRHEQRTDMIHYPQGPPQIIQNKWMNLTLASLSS